MGRANRFLRFLILLGLVLAAASPVSAKGKDGGYQTGFDLWRASQDDFSDWSQSVSTPGSDPIAAGAYYGGNFYNAGSFWVSELVSPQITAPFGFRVAIASWNTDTPAGTWVETQIQVKIAGLWSKWYNLGVWASDTDTVQRHSVRLQGDADGYVAVDTLVVSSKAGPAEAYQLKVRLFSEDNTTFPVLNTLSLAFSTSPPKKAAAVSAGDPALWNTLLNVPECSQMVYPDGGEVWCSPTSTSMVLGFYGIDPGACEPRVRAAVDGVYDWIYDGHGNWPFNTAYAASRGMEAYVARFTSLDQVEPWIKAGIPVVASIAWGKNDLTGSTIPSTGGHLLVIVGFDSTGNPIINDPAASTDEAVQVIYLREEFEPLWQQAAGGTVYLIFPSGMPHPVFP